MSENSPLERLREFLSGLTPESQARLVAELEKAKLKGEAIPGTELILEQLRAGLRDFGKPIARTGNPGRLFFAPLEPFLINEILERKQRGRICRSSLGPIWTWITRDLLPADAKSYSDAVIQSLLTESSAHVEHLVGAFQEHVLSKIQDALNRAQEGIPNQRLTAQLGGQRVFEDLKDVVAIYHSKDAINLIASRLPLQINNLDADILQGVKEVLESPTASHSDVFPYALVMILEKLAQPAQLVRLAIRTVNSDQPAKIAASAYGVTVDLALSEIERLVLRLKASLRRAPGEVLVAHVKEFHDSARTLHTEMELKGEHPWVKRLAQLRTDLAMILKDEMEALPGKMRRLLRARPASEMASGQVDEMDITEIEGQIELLAACRTYAQEIAMNEVTLRVYAELQNYLESSTQALIEALRTSSEIERPYRASQANAAIRFAAKVFGSSHAALLQKAADVAMQGEKNQARA